MSRSIESKILVEQLVAAATNAMVQLADGSSSEEILAACFTMTLRVIQAAVSLGTVEPAQVQQAIGCLYLGSMDPGVKPN